MNYKSLLELLIEEQTLCRILQAQVNFLAGRDAAVKAGTIGEGDHQELVSQLETNIEQGSQALYNLRLAIGARIMELQGTAERALMEHLRSADGEGPGDSHE